MYTGAVILGSRLFFDRKRIAAMLRKKAVKIEKDFLIGDVAVAEQSTSK
jgi:hypothetical protein